MVLGSICLDFLVFALLNPFYKPSAFESEIHPSHKPSVYAQGYFALPGADIRNPLRYLLMNAAASQYSERASLYKHLQCFLRSNADAFVFMPDTSMSSYTDAYASTHNKIIVINYTKKGENAYCKKFIYTDFKTDKSKR